MPKSDRKLTSAKKRVKVKDLPAAETKLSKKEMDNVKGGIVVGNFVGTDINAKPKTK